MQLHRSLSLPVFAFASALLALPAVARDLGPLVEISQPNFVGNCNTGFNPFGLSWPSEESIEPVVAVNPVNPKNIVAAWIQGSWQDILTATSFDGGQTWKPGSIPLTTCSNGPFLGAIDPWLSFAPNGTLYAVALATNSSSLSTDVVEMTRSLDGGVSWSTPSPVTDTVAQFADHPSVTADPTNSGIAYAIWDGLSKGLTKPSKSNEGVFTRTTDGGLTWEPARAIVQTPEQSFIQASQILVLPNGTLVDIFEFYEAQPKKPITFTNLQVLHSTDRGQTWSAPINAVTMTPLYAPGGNTLVVNPNNSAQSVLDVTDPSFAVDGRNGNLYAVWEDGRFSKFQYNDIAFSMSSDGGLTWSTPIRVNQTPLNIPALDRQAFFPSIAVKADGTIGVSYYDFRFTSTGLWLTDRWLVQCQPSSANAAANATCWGNEARLTSSSFNMTNIVPVAFGEFYLGDYFGLAAGNFFEGVFVQPDQSTPPITSIFVRQVQP